MISDEFKKMSLTEIDKELKTLQRLVYKLRLDLGTNQSKESHKLRALKLKIAQLNTLKHGLRAQSASAQ